MTVVFDAEPLLAFAFDEPGAAAVERRLDAVYDGSVDGYVTTINLAELRYVAARLSSVERADSHVEHLRQLGVRAYGIDDLWREAANLKAAYSISIGDAYAVAAAAAIDDGERNATLLVGADDDYDALRDSREFGHLIERFRDEPA